MAADDIPNGPCPVQKNARSRWDALPYLYLLRVTIITLLVLVSFPFVSLWAAPALLRGIFDVTWQGMVFVALGAILASWTAMVTAWQVLLYGPERFHIRPFPLNSSLLTQPPSPAGHFPVFAIFALPSIVVAMYVSRDGNTATIPRLLLGVLGGAALAVVILIAGDQFKSRGWSEAKPVTAFLSFFGPGFKKDSSSAYEGHYMALWSFFLCLLVYAAIGIGKFASRGNPATVPTLADLLVFLIILCWGLSALTFILDRFRIPLLLPFLLWAIFSAQFRATDHYVYVRGTTSATVLCPSAVIRAGKPGAGVIVVAASGGGIKAAAWTARVLTGLEKLDPGKFGGSVRLISSVSGGSVGAMYFVNEYDANGTGLPASTAELEKAVGYAKSSSLDDIAWGLVYPDFLRVFVPVFFRHLDRGQALEAALTRGSDTSKDLLLSPLSTWRAGVLNGARPAVVFNATVVESGQRFLMGTTELNKSIQGRSSLQDEFGGRDIPIVTAARLSATFPYVSPAARPDIEGKQVHVVDGGYTDNFGMATLLAWLEEALFTANNPVRRVLIIEIRASPPASATPTLSWRGWPFQAYAPISAMLNVRDNGQMPRNDEERRLLKAYADSCNIDVEHAVFEYPSEDAPLSWHLSPKDEDEIESTWITPSDKLTKGKQAVHAFLAAPELPPLTAPASAACRIDFR
jgi:Patatin-like phospholipase